MKKSAEISLFELALILGEMEMSIECFSKNEITYLKIDVLLNMNMPDLALEVIKANFLPMAKESGTLWEHLSGYKSRNHGFASYAAVAIDKALHMK
jgi:hypothetical protein